MISANTITKSQQSRDNSQEGGNTDETPTNEIGPIETNETETELNIEEGSELISKEENGIENSSGASTDE